MSDLLPCCSAVAKRVENEWREKYLEKVEQNMAQGRTMTEMIENGAALEKAFEKIILLHEHRMPGTPWENRMEDAVVIARDALGETVTA